MRLDKCLYCQEPETLRSAWTMTGLYFWATRLLRWTMRASFSGAEITANPQMPRRQRLKPDRAGGSFMCSSVWWYLSVLILSLITLDLITSLWFLLISFLLLSRGEQTQKDASNQQRLKLFVVIKMHSAAFSHWDTRSHTSSVI